MIENNDKRFTFAVKGMTCVSCVRIVERNLARVDGVKFLSVNLATEKAYVITDNKIEIGDLKGAVEKSGYEFAEDYSESSVVEGNFRDSEKSIKISLLIFVPVTILMILHMTGVKIPGYYFIEFFSGLVMFIFPGRKIFRSAFIAGAHGHSNMDTLVSMGSIAAWSTSGLKIAGLNILSFGAISVMLITLHLTGRYIESRLKLRASREIRALLAMKSSVANLIEGDDVVVVPVDTVKPESSVLVRSGERIPLDGIITEGSGYVDESMITGEPDRVSRKEGDELTGGSVLEKGLLKVRVTRAGEDTFLSRMIRLIEDAQSSKVPLQALADRITVYFVPGVFILALFSSAIWYFSFHKLGGYIETVSAHIPWIPADAGPVSMSLFIFVAVLVIACPCALGLATPMALIAGTGLAASQGLLIKNGEAMERAGKIDYIFFDKTGTLTHGKPQVVSTDLDEKGLAIAYGLGSSSVHPVSYSIKRYCEGNNILPEKNLEDVTETAGSGIHGTFGGIDYFLGRPGDSDRYSDMMNRGETVVEFRMGKDVMGYISISDPLKDDAAETVKNLKIHGIVPVMLTGDNEKTARAVAGLLEIENVIAGVKPDQKLYAIQEKQMDGKLVSMVGDGINDAAALKSSDLGIAIGTGTDLSIESADVIITGNELMSVIKAVLVSRLTVKKIRQNLFWAFFYNIIAIPAAVMGLLHPLIAESAMVFSSINVVINSNRIRKKNMGGRL